jgi:hypothetical protein
MAALNSAPLSAHPWQTLYKAALLEADKRKIPDKIAYAQRAIVERARELSVKGNGGIEEDQALDDALFALRILRGCLRPDIPITLAPETTSLAQRILTR